MGGKLESFVIKDGQSIIGSQSLSYKSLNLRSIWDPRKGFLYVFQTKFRSLLLRLDYKQLTALPGPKPSNVLHGPGIEPRPPAWEARILPLNHPCTNRSIEEKQ